MTVLTQIDDRSPECEELQPAGRSAPWKSDKAGRAVLWPRNVNQAVSIHKQSPDELELTRIRHDL